MPKSTDEIVRRLLQGLLITATEIVGTEVVSDGTFQENEKLTLQTQAGIYVGYFQCACMEQTFTCNAQILDQEFSASDAQPYWH